MFTGMKWSLAVTVVLVFAARAHAGPDAPPPTPPADRGPLHQIADERRAVRGCPVGDDCGRDDARATLREIDVELFGRGADADGDPWLDGAESRPAIGRTPPP